MKYLLPWVLSASTFWTLQAFSNPSGEWRGPGIFWETQDGNPLFSENCPALTVTLKVSESSMTIANSTYACTSFDSWPSKITFEIQDGYLWYRLKRVGRFVDLNNFEILYHWPQGFSMAYKIQFDGTRVHFEETWIDFGKPGHSQGTMGDLVLLTP